MPVFRRGQPKVKDEIELQFGKDKMRGEAALHRIRTLTADFADGADEHEIAKNL